MVDARRSGEGERGWDLPGGSLGVVVGGRRGGRVGPWSRFGSIGMEEDGFRIGRGGGEDDVASLAKRVGRERLDVRGVRKGEMDEGLGTTVVMGGGRSA